MGVPGGIQGIQDPNKDFKKNLMDFNDYCLHNAQISTD